MEDILLFPGQGSQYVGMAQNLMNSKIGQALVKEAEDALSLPLKKIMVEGPQEELTNTAIAQPAIVLHSVLALRNLEEKTKVAPTLVIGHSLGEYSALVSAEVLPFYDCIKVVHVRGRLMQEAVPKGQGAMAAVLGMDAEKISEALNEFSNDSSPTYAAAANFNGPLQTVIAGTKAGVLKASEKLKELGAKRIIELDVSAPFHSALMKPVKQRMKAVLDGIKFSEAKFPLISNVNAQAVKNPAEIKALLLEQITSPVNFTGCIKTAMNLVSGERKYLELGPKNTLGGIAKKIDSEGVFANFDSLDDLSKLS